MKGRDRKVFDNLEAVEVEGVAKADAIVPQHHASVLKGP